MDENILTHSDVYYSREYIQLYEEKEKGKTETVYFENEFGKVEYTFIKRRTPFKVEGKQYYDITTAYGYGGPCIRDCIDAKSLLEDFNQSFRKYCNKNDIVSEFVRFHLFENQEVQTYFDGEVSMIGNHVARNLKEPLDKNFHKSIRTSIRKAKREGLSVSFDSTGENIKDFLSIYYETMNRNDAEPFYYFKESFFEELHQSLKGKFLYSQALFEGEIIASYLNIIGKDYIYGFLGGTKEKYFDYNASTYLEYQTIKYAKEKGLQYYIMGGGYEENDGIYKYKKKFDLQGDYPFYIGKKIHNEKIYEALNAVRAEEKETFDADSNFFPLYRS
ncbi:GNAT family N-acetyltransferase [Jeotgalibaca sp. MA1X17-3]|uniref:GNAT family N-acetyltransferase n=1 Tax=Jeotgalibaca sp. MA1X17-3 TaxID=2908211 RepID=UPI001F4065B3|nr:GNAT family N-acetyltransferase [Jeotgalibaca sp. MA1X17-3]UJF15394.1 GNAT family N-acetyltransferase [Jeotgalibaca sp. MA1X17-3]